MAGALSTYGDNAFLNHLFGTPFTPPANLYLALSTNGSLGKGATGASMSEVANANGYAREAITFGAASARAVAQSVTVTFPQASGSWGTVAGWAIVDSATYGAGNVLTTGSFTSSFSPVSGNTVSIASGQIDVAVSASSGAGYTTACVNNMLNLMFRNVAYSQPATYVALLNVAASDSSTVLSSGEESGTAYARVLVNKVGGSSPAWGAIASGSLSDANAIVFPTVGSGGWTQLNGMAIVDSGTIGAGNILCYDNTDIVQQTPVATDTILFGAGALDESMN
jgi:hypothetical protein